MRRIQRVSDVIELISETALTYGFGGVVCLALSGYFFYYARSSSMTMPLATVLLVIGLGLTGFAIKQALRIREVEKFNVHCPYCNEDNAITTAPEDDFTCAHCHRLIPIVDGKPLPVSQVRCGYCNELNYYSDKTDVLLCEACNHEIPISTSDDRPKKELAAAYRVVDDEASYELVLVEKGNKTEEVIQVLQHMLALNRNQVKQMLDELPVTLLQGIPRKKAEIFQAQLTMHDARAEMRQMPNP